MRIVKRILLTLTCLLVLCVSALASEQTGSITLHFNIDGEPVSGASFQVYRLAELRDDGSYVLTPQYASYPVKPASTEQEWQTLYVTYAGYTRRDQLTSSAQGVIDENGIVTLSELPKGLYLVLGDRIETEATSVLPSECLLSLPARRGEDWCFEVDVDVKSEVKPLSGSETVERRAIKIWDDAGHEDERPDKITVQLLCDGEIFDMADLTAENNWRYVWDELDAACRWEVVEKECPDYTVKVEKSGVTFTLTNNHVPSETPPKKPDPATPKPRLPQTGQLWWPVPLLAFTGAVLLVLGVRKRRKNHEA